jgi:hypothetical protein
VTRQSFGVLWIKESVLISKLLKGYFNIKPVKPRIMTTWDVSTFDFEIPFVMSDFQIQHTRLST